MIISCNFFYALDLSKNNKDGCDDGFTKVCSKNMDLLIKKNSFQTGKDDNVDQKTSQNSLSRRLKSEVNKMIRTIQIKRDTPGLRS